MIVFVTLNNFFNDTSQRKTSYKILSKYLLACKSICIKFEENKNLAAIHLTFNMSFIIIMSIY